MKKIWRKIDKPLFIASTILALFGLLMIFSASSVSTILRYNVSSSYFFLRQTLFLAAAYVVGIILLFKFPTKKYIKYIFPGAILILVMLIGLFTLSSDNGSVQSWYALGPVSLQPSEFAKAGLIIFSAVYYNSMVKGRIKNLASYLIPVAFGLTCTILTYLQPDLGSAIILLGITYCMFIAVPFHDSKLINLIKYACIILGVVGIIILSNGSSFLSEYQYKRFEYADPCTRYTEDTGYQVCNGFIAINNGGLFGVGLGNSTQKYLYLPESHTDFIFPIIVEELGLLVGILIILTYGFILFRIFKIAKKATTVRGSLLAYGTFCLFAMHVMVNLLGILALIPLTGVPLPLLSYGGSSTIVFVVLLFITQSVAIETKEEKMKKELSSL